MQSNNNTKKPFGISNLFIKILAVISMTCDHVGYYMERSYDYETLSYILRCVGRLALPLFLFLLIEGLIHTKSLKKYLFRLGISALLIYAGIFISQCFFNIYFSLDGNIFVTLFLLALSYAILKSKVKFLIILPIAYFLAAPVIFILNSEGGHVWELTTIFNIFNGLYPQYELLAPPLFFGILIAYKIYDISIYRRVQKNEVIVDEFKKTKEYQRSKNMIACIVIVIFTVICYLITYQDINSYVNLMLDAATQTWMIVAILPIALYNGQLGHYNKVLKYGFYLYYPIHLILIGLLL